MAAQLAFKGRSRVPNDLGFGLDRGGHAWSNERMEFRILGPLHVTGRDGPIAIEAGKVRALLELLLLHANEVIPTDRLIDSLWGESPSDTAEHAVEVYVSRLRRALGADRVQKDARGYRVRVLEGELDLQRFEALTAEAQQAFDANDAAQSARLFREADALWRGPPVVDLRSSDRTQAELARLDELRLAETEARIDAMLATGQHGQLISELEKLVADQPFRERLLGQLMLALYRSGRQVDALEAFQRARKALDEDLGLEPGPDLQQLQLAILRQDPALTARGPGGGPKLSVEFLGQFSLSVDGQRVDGPRNPRLLTYLVLNRDRTLTREEVAFALWPDSGDAQALTNLRRELHAIRHVLPDADRHVALDHRSIRWRMDTPGSIDVAEFESAVQDPSAGAANLRAAVDLYRGDLLPGVYDEWLEPHRERLRALFIDALARLGDRLEERREYREAMAVMRRLIAADALDERAYRGLIRLAAAAGDRSAGLHAYHACSTVLNDELGVAPSRETQAAYEALLAGDRGKTAPARSTDATPQNRLVGRAAPWAALGAAVEEARAGRPTMALLTGDPGIGKSRISEELVRWARTQEIAAAYGRCYAAEGGLVYATPATWLRTEPFLGGLRQLDSTWLTEIARLLPELVAEMPDLPAPEPMTESWQRHRLFEAITRAIRRSTPALLVLDDANWSDDETLEWLHYLLRAEPPVPVTVLLSVRSEDLTTNPRIQALMLDMRERSGLREIELGGLNEKETLELAELVADRPLDLAERATLFEGTDGLPLMVVELARSGLPTDASDSRRTGPLPEALRSQGPGHLLPARMRAVITARLDQLTPDARRLLELAAAFGRDFPFEALAAASDLDEPAVAGAVDELWQRRLVRERGLGTYDVSHDRIRDVAYGETLPARRRTLHRRIAQALELLHGSDLDPVAGQIAAHLEAAGQPRRAAELYERAAEVAGRVSAFAEVMRSLDRALALLELEAPSRARDERELALVFRRSPALNAVAGYSSPKQEAAFVRARELAESLDRPRDVSAAISGASVAAVVAGRIDEAFELAELGVTRASHPDDESGAYGALAATQSARGSIEAAIAAFRAALDTYRPGGSPLMLAGNDPANISVAFGAYTLWLNGRSDEALTWSADAIKRAVALDNPYAMAIAHDYAAILSQLRDDSPALIVHAEAAADLCARYDFAYYAEWPVILSSWAVRVTDDSAAERIEGALDRMAQLRSFLRRPYYLWLLADAHRAAGRRDAALATLAEALAVADANGEHWWTPEIYRLTGELTANPEAADAHLERALATARTQASHALALRAGISIVRRHPDRRDLLATLLAATPSPNERERSEVAALLASQQLTN
jgi:DNA-binding SARP family transcriptional activator